MIISRPNGLKTIQLETKELRITSREKAVSDLTKDDFSIPDLEWNNAVKVFYMFDGKVKVLKSAATIEPKTNFFSKESYVPQEGIIIKHDNQNSQTPVKVKTDFIPYSYYQKGVNNIISYLKDNENGLTAFQLSEAAAVIFDKNKDEILSDILKGTK
jgi:hypothetical protein